MLSKLNSISLIRQREVRLFFGSEELLKTKLLMISFVLTIMFVHVIVAKVLIALTFKSQIAQKIISIANLEQLV